MKLKKLFAGILAVAMMATMAAPAFAATTYVGANGSSKIEVDGEGHAYLPVTKNFKVESGTAPDTMNFTFTLAKKDVDPQLAEGAKTPAVPEAVNDALKVTIDKSLNNNSDLVTGTTVKKDFYIDLAALGITHVGKYTYELSENEANIPGVTCDTTKLTLVVSVVNANATNPDGENFAYYAALSKNGEKISYTDAFTNTYSALQGTVTKKVEGDFADLSKTFKFKVTLSKIAEAEGKTNNYKGAIVSSTNNTVNNPATISFDDGVGYVYLKRGDTVTISNLPAGVSYTIEEVQDDGYLLTDYKTKINDVDSTDRIASHEKIAESFNDTYTNTREGTPDTGVILDNAPYIALMMVVVAGAAVMIIKKRRHFED